MKIIVIGAGHGGLQAAKYLAEGGADVTVFEKNAYGNLCYDWIDDVEPTVFEELDVPLPAGHFRTANVAFCIPDMENPVRVEQAETSREWSIERRLFAQMLADRAEAAGAKIAYETPVDALIIEDEKVRGVSVNGKKLYADLVIDSSGVNSKFRASLPQAYKITKAPARDELFKVYRAFYTPTDGVPTPRDTKKIYLKHLGEDGISWCFVEPDRETNVLICRVGELSQETVDRALAALKRTDPIIGDRLLRGGFICDLPVRYALPKMVGDGYAAIGDAAFMTVPMIGSGISNCLRAGKMLAETVLNANKTDVKSLWAYQYQYYTKIGAGHTMVDIMKRMLLSLPAKDINFLFSSGIIGDAEMNSIATGEKLTLSPAQILDKLKKGWRRLPLLLTLVKAITSGEKAEAHALTIPKEYDEVAVNAWQSKLNAFFN